MSGKILTGNRVADGAVVFFTGTATWDLSLDAAWVAEDDATIAEFEAIASHTAEGTEVTDLYLFDATQNGDTIVPDHIRERIRAIGPTVRNDLGKQAQGTGASFQSVA